MGWLSALLASIALHSPANVQARDFCLYPDLQPSETHEDLPWAAAARALQEQARESKPVAPALKAALPALAAQLAKDARHPTLKRLWGECLNFDENAKEIIVDPAILDALADLIKLPHPSGRIAHAGMEHTYGYLFSTIRTPYGFKRARWVHGELERGFGLPQGLLGPSTREGTFFSNVTYFFGSIAFREDARELAALRGDSSDVASAIHEAKLDGLRIRRIVEKAEDSPVEIRTDLVEFPSPDPKESGSCLIIYSIRDSRDGARLITGFPVTRASADALLLPETLGSDKPIALRYNGYLPGFSGAEHRGTRRVE